MGEDSPLEVAVLTTWYPTAEHPSAGAFIAEDCAALATVTQLTVIYANPRAREVTETQRDGYTLVTVPYAQTRPRGARQLRREIAARFGQVRVIHTMALPAALAWRRARPRHLRHIPWIHTEHLSDLVRTPRNLTQILIMQLASKLLRSPSRIVAVSEHLRAVIEKITGRQDVTVIPNIVRSRGIRSPRTREGEPLRVIAAGGLIDRKQPILTVRALAHYPHPVELDWYGDGPLRQEMEIVAEELKVPVHLHGAVPKEKLLEALPQYDVFYVPTRRETFFLGAAEALAAGLPVLTSNAGAHTEFLPQWATTMLDPHAEPDMWAEALGELLEKTATVAPDDIARSMAHLSPQMSAEKYRTVIEGVL